MHTITPSERRYQIDFVKVIFYPLISPLSPSPRLFFPLSSLYRLGTGFNPSRFASVRTRRIHFFLPPSTCPCKRDGNCTESSTFPTCLLRLNYTVSLRRGGISAGIREIAFPFVARRKEQRYWKMLMCANKLKLLYLQTTGIRKRSLVSLPS